MSGAGTHAPPLARVGASGGLLLAGLVPGAAAAALVGGGIGLGAGGVLAAIGVAGAVRAWPLRIEVHADRLLVRNPLRRTELAPDEVEVLRDERFSQVGVVRRDGKVLRVVASLPVPGSTHQRSELFLDLRRWCARNHVKDALAHHEYDDGSVRLDLLASTEEVEVSAVVRRTDSRGWGGWEHGTLLLPSLPASGPSRWATEELSLAGSPQPERPVQLRDAEKVSIRQARFPEESFFGPDTTFLVITTLRRTMEIALRAEEGDLVLTRIKQTDGLEPLPAPPAVAVTEPEPEPEIDGEPEVEAEPAAAGEPDVEAEPEPAAEPDAAAAVEEPRSEAEPTPEDESENEADTVTETEPAPATEPEGSADA